MKECLSFDKNQGGTADDPSLRHLFGAGTFLQRDVASSPPIEAFSLEENTCNGVSKPCNNLAVTLGTNESDRFSESFLPT